MPSVAVNTEDLARLWAGAFAFVPHMAGCGCMGSMHVMLDRDAVEEDILDYLLAKYRQAKRNALADFVAERLDSRLQPKHTAFGVWLADIGTAALKAEDMRLIEADLRATLGSMNGPAMGGGFQCN